MRSKLLYSAEHRVHHEFLLASLAIRAMRRLPHSESTRTEDRMNQALSMIAEASASAVAIPSTAPPPGPAVK
jgi:hypothetical protein